ncbi:hypothetical protein [Halorussus ruber]|uniref:hypothetical protein n=1 Tax=Halorussus ruber TaxID=1126238 RepID=UPI0010929C64|nr:hypothetical protein [Halorussus ruber]
MSNDVAQHTESERIDSAVRGSVEESSYSVEVRRRLGYVSARMMPIANIRTAIPPRRYASMSFSLIPGIGSSG